jgi:phosphosulfolactate phosphohydrolase-like enzyme
VVDAKGLARVAVIGAGTRGEFREEDQMCCAWIAARLVEAGYVAQNASTRALIGRWRAEPAQACLESKSVDYLRRTRQLEDLDFILSHIKRRAATGRIALTRASVLERLRQSSRGSLFSNFFCANSCS